MCIESLCQGGLGHLQGRGSQAGMRRVTAEGAARRQQHARARQHLHRLQPTNAACMFDFGY